MTANQKLTDRDRLEIARRAVAVQKWTGSNQEGVRAGLSETIESCFNFTWCGCLQKWSHQPKRTRCCFHIGAETGGRPEIGIDEDGDRLRMRNKLAQKIKPFRREFPGKNSHSGSVSTRPAKTCNVAKPNWIAAAVEDLRCPRTNRARTSACTQLPGT